MALSSVSGTHLLVAIVGLFAAKVAYELFLSPLRHFPGPLAAKSTNIYRAIINHAGDSGRHMRNWHRRWGDAVRVGPNTISLGDPDLIKVVYATKNAWIKSDMYRVNDVVVNGKRMSTIFNTPDKDFHAKYTKPIGGFWTMTKILEFEPLMDETLVHLVDMLRRRFADGNKGGTTSTCMMDEWLGYFAWDVAANVSFGRHYGFIERGHDIEGMMSETRASLTYFTPVSQIPWLDEWLDKNPVWRIGPRPMVRGFRYTVDLLSDYQQELAAGTLERKKSAELFIDKYNGLKDTVDFVDDNQVINWLMLNVLAGGDSTAGAMRSVFYYVSRHPATQKKLVDELDAANLTVPAQWKDIKNLSYLDAVIFEAQRVCPAVGLMLERYVPAGGLELSDGRCIPAGTKVGMNPYVVTQDKHLFGDDVDLFRPERWIRSDGESPSEYSHRHRHMAEATDLMYGAGNRVCMGKYMARTEMYKVVATLFRAFDIRLTDPQHEWNYCNSWFMYQSDMPMTLTWRGK